MIKFAKKIINVLANLVFFIVVIFIILYIIEIVLPGIFYTTASLISVSLVIAWLLLLLLRYSGTQKHWYQIGFQKKRLITTVSAIFWVVYAFVSNIIEKQNYNPSLCDPAPANPILNYQSGNYPTVDFSACGPPTLLDSLVGGIWILLLSITVLSLMYQIYLLITKR